jgi:hypothetical protein
MGISKARSKNDVLVLSKPRQKILKQSTRLISAHHISSLQEVRCEAGFDARYMAGGHFAWKAIKGPVKLFA